MTLNLSKRWRRPPSLARDHALIHAECPIEQSLHSDDPGIQSRLLQEPWSRGARPEGALFVADYTGLRVLGRSETALDVAVRPLRRRYGDRLRVGAPGVRYAFGVPTLEPYMTVLINGPEHSLPTIKKDFLQRRGRIRRLQRRAFFILEGEAPLAGLLGYEQWIRALTAAAPHVGLWLARYLPIDQEVRQAA